MLFGQAYRIDVAKYFFRKEDERIREAVERRQRRSTRRAQHRATAENVLAERAEEVHADLGRMLLLAAAVRRVLVGKGVLSPGEIAAVARELDLADGVSDGKLDPRVVRPAALAPRPSRPQRGAGRRPERNR